MPSFRSVAGLAPAAVLVVALGCGEPVAAPPASGTAAPPRPMQVAGLQVAPEPPGQVREPADEQVAPGAKKWIVQLAGPVREEHKRAIAEAGGRLGDYLPDFAFVVSADAAARRRIEQLPFVSGLARLRPEHRVAAQLRGGGRGGAVRLHVRADDGEALLDVLAHVHRRGGRVLDVGRDVARIELDAREIAALSARESVVWIEEAADLHLVNDTTKWVIQSNVAPQTPVWAAGLHGEGQIVGIGDTGLDHDMPWFRDPAGTAIGPAHRKVVLYDPRYGDGSDANDPGHGTHVAGTVGGDRTPVDGGTAANGMAPKARFAIQDITPGASRYVYPPSDLGVLFVTAYDAGARLHTNSWGGGGSGYTTEAMTADRFAWEHPDFLPLFANGNSGSSPGTVGYPATAKNVVSVGATLNGSGDANVTSFSSHGPTFDGRIKPTVTAPGDGVTEGAGIISADSDGALNSLNSGVRSLRGTSMATPAVAGAAALVRQYFMDGYYPSGVRSPADAFTPSADLVKAVLVASGESMGGAYTAGPAPSMGQGFGRVNLSSALGFAGDRTAEIVRGAGLATGETWSHSYLVSGTRPLEMTLVWTDYPGSTAAAKALVNDLDLVVTAPDGTSYRGNAFTGGASDPDGGPDRLNVEEQVLVRLPAGGYYRVSVEAFNVPNGPQPFALVVSGASSVTSLGAVMLDRHRYRPAGTVAVIVGDRDLDLDPQVADSAVVRVSTSSEPGGEALTLVETGPSTGTFAGSVGLDPGATAAGDGLLAAAEGDAVTAVYEDADDGLTGPAVRTASAVVDARPPAISGVTSEVLWEGAARVRWTTDEPADSAVEHGKTAALGLRAEGRRISLDHSLDVGGLVEATTYFFDVLSADEAGNIGRDDAGGQHHTLTTPSVPPTLSAASSDFWHTVSPTTRIFGTARDATLVSVTVNGAPVPVRASDGYFEVTVDLAVGDNRIPVVATDAVGATTTVTVRMYRVLPSDLIVTSFTGPPQAGTGMFVNVTYSIQNVGEAVTSCWGESGSYPCYVNFYCHPAGSADLGFHVGRAGMPHLYPGDSWSATVPVRLPIAQGAGLYVLEAYVDGKNEVPESDETNNRRASEPFPMLLPDLVFTELWGSTPALSGGTITIHNTLSNIGGGAAQPVYADLYLSADPVLGPGDMMFTYRRVPDSGTTTYIDPGSNHSADAVVTLPSGLMGTYYLGAITTEFSYWPFPEVDETNNVLVVPIEIIGPDFSMVSVSGPPEAGTGATISVSDTIYVDPAGAPGRNVCVGLYFSTDAVITTGDVLLGSRCMSNVPPGETSGGTTTVTIPYVSASGTYYLGAIADFQGSIPESNETNNAVVGNAIAISLPDLTMTAIDPPLVVTTGSTISLSDTVANAPVGGIAKSFFVGYFLSMDAAISMDDTLIGQRALSSLAPGATSSGTGSAKIPLNIWGPRYLGAYADSKSQGYYGVYPPTVAESNETNNAIDGRAIQVVGSDVAVTGVTGPPAPVLYGSTVYVYTTIANDPAAGKAGAVDLYLYASPDPEITTSDAPVWSGTAVASLNPGQSYTIKSGVSMLNARYRNGGTWYIGAIAKNAEENLANNVRAGPPFTVVVP